MFATLQESIQTTMFNQPTNFYHYSLGGLIFAEIGLTDKFGYSWFEYRGDYQWEVDIWQLKGCIISDTLYGEMTDVQPIKEIPYRLGLSQNYPNPFNPSTKIRFTISDFGFTTLKVYDVLGNEVATLVNEENLPGVYEVKFDASQLSSGIYFYKLQTEKYSSTKSMIYIK